MSRLPALLALLALSLLGCVAHAADPALMAARARASAAVLLIENTEASALMLYRAEQEAVLDQAVAARWTEDRAVAELGRIRLLWAPVREALVSVRAEHEALRAALEAARAQALAGDTPDTRAALEASERLSAAERRAAALLAEARARVAVRP